MWCYVIKSRKSFIPKLSRAVSVELDRHAMNSILAIKHAQAVCFDVDSTVIQEEGVNYLLMFQIVLWQIF